MKIISGKIVILGMPLFPIPGHPITPYFNIWKYVHWVMAKLEDKIIMKNYSDVIFNLSCTVWTPDKGKCLWTIFTSFCTMEFFANHLKKRCQSPHTAPLLFVFSHNYNVSMGSISQKSISMQQNAFLLSACNVNVEYKSFPFVFIFS